MHELSIAENIVEIINENVTGHEAVMRVRIKIGKLANVVLDSLEFCFRAITKGTRFENTKLEIENVNILAHCSRCGVDSEIEGFLFQCKSCYGTDVELISGNELKVVEIEINN